MKFEYDDEKDRGECVAFIDSDGDLIVKTESGNSIWISTFGEVHDNFGEFNDTDATYRFYPGDKITITF
jgi:hypothetical protein